MADQDIRAFKTGELADRARAAGVKDAEKMNKSQLLDALGVSEPDSAKPGHGGGQGDAPQPEGTRPEEWKNIPGNQS
jgi:hypothetical protein